LERWEIDFALLQESERERQERERAKGRRGAQFADIGNPDGYQKKGVAGEAKWIVVKTKEIANLAQNGTRGPESRENPGKSGVE